ncbi:type II secretion system protein [Candidatus Woesebacteria bacterium]|nr:type II secretion system protein [Candidatus Woesebacteria bacterium]
MVKGLKSHNSYFIIHNSGKSFGFTLVELLVVMAIIGVLVTLIGTTFRNAQIRGRDVERKSDLNQISKALELFFSDYGLYPDGDLSGLILGCPYNPTTGIGAACSWGTSELTDGTTTYFKQLPTDPTPTETYFYRVVPNSNRQKFQIFAHLENPDDQDCLAGDCANSPVTYSCGNDTCNFAITSSNTTATE